jgi:hypothetical protein
MMKYLAEKADNEGTDDAETFLCVILIFVRVRNLSACPSELSLATGTQCKGTESPSRHNFDADSRSPNRAEFFCI